MDSTKGNNVYIADIKSILPNQYTTSEVVNILYPKTPDNEKMNKFVQRVAGSVGIKTRYSILDAKALPNKKIADESYSPLSWGKQMVQYFSGIIDIKQVGFLSVSYNISSHDSVLPNLACQVAAESGLNLDSIPEEISYYGCASGIFSLNSAVEYCKKSNKAAIVFIFDQCSWGLQPLSKLDDESFKSDLKSNLLFSDGAIGLLVIPEKMKQNFNRPLLRIDELALDHFPGNSIRMRNGGLTLEKDTKDVIPLLVSNRLVKPLLKKLNYKLSDISEWALHQGGLPILDNFRKKEILGLSEELLEPSRLVFEGHGNLSSPSAFLVLEYFFNEKKSPIDSIGMTVSFGAGYYLAAFVYTWH